MVTKGRIGDLDHLILDRLFVSPRFLNRGVEERLVSWGEERADFHYLSTMVACSPYDHKLFENRWEHVGDLVSDLNE